MESPNGPKRTDVHFGCDLTRRCWPVEDVLTVDTGSGKLSRVLNRQDIDGTLTTLNSTENDTSLAPSAKSDVFDLLSADDFVGSANGVETGDRAAERDREATLFGTFPDYQRRFVRVVIDPPMAAVSWVLTGSNAELGVKYEVHGSTIFEFTDDARIRRHWLYFHDPLA